MAHDVVSAARSFRKQARQRGSKARATLLASYARVFAGVRKDAEVLSARVERMRRDGVVPSTTDLERLAEATRLRDNTAARLLKAADGTMSLASKEASREVGYALRDAQHLTTLVGKTDLHGLDESTVLNLVGVSTSGPLRDLLRARAGKDADKVRDLMVGPWTVWATHPVRR